MAVTGQEVIILVINLGLRDRPDQPAGVLTAIQIKDCPQPKNNEKEKDKTDSQTKGNVCLSSTNHAGLFVQAKFGEYGEDCLVDTGATLSLLSTKVCSTSKVQQHLRNLIRTLYLLLEMSLIQKAK